MLYLIALYSANTMHLQSLVYNSDTGVVKKKSHYDKLKEFIGKITDRCHCSMQKYNAFISTRFTR